MQNKRAVESTAAPSESAASAAGCDCAPTCCLEGFRQQGNTPAGMTAETRNRAAPDRVG